MFNVLNNCFTPLIDSKKNGRWDNEPFIHKWPEAKIPDKHRKVPEITKPIKKKAKRKRTAFTTDQINMLEDIFSKNPYIDTAFRKHISSITNIGDKQIKIWFQNRRMKEKKSATDSDNKSECSNFSSSMPVFYPETPEQYQEPFNYTENFHQHTFKSEKTWYNEELEKYCVPDHVTANDNFNDFSNLNVDNVDIPFDPTEYQNFGFNLQNANDYCPEAYINEAYHNMW